MGDLEGSPAPQHDTIWFAVKGAYKLPGKRPSSVYRFQRLQGEALEHPNQKPLLLMGQLITDYTPKGGVVLEPFAGSGSTLVAGIRGGFRVVGIEIDPEHYATTVRRLKVEIKLAEDRLW